jgi:exopolyphosphatase / guanosine-5'-triphosphate,3'-diphosphate pyrophosphatase
VAPELRTADLIAVREQLGREPTVPFSVVARCTGGHPLVIRNAAADADGTPFPTTYWLTCPAAAKAVSRLEAGGAIARLNARADADAAFAAALEAAHREAAAERADALPGADGWGGVGGTRRGVKCLHAHYANHLAGGGDPVGAEVAAAVEPIHPRERAGRVAVLDQGTNSIRLLVVERAEGPGSQPTELARDMAITRLGRDVDRTGRFDPRALARTVHVLGRYARRARALHAERIRVVATSAVRDVADRAGFADAVRELTGTELEVIDGEREAGLSFLGAIHGLEGAAPSPYVVLDVGGGSTELVLGDDPRAPGPAVSLRIGSVRLTERHVRSDPPTTRDLDAIRREVSGRLDEAEAAVPVRDARTLVAVAGTATTVQALALGLPRDDPDRIHRSWLGRADAARILTELAAMTTEERAALPPMPPGRADVIVAGATVLVQVMERFGFDRALVSEADILDGLALELLGIR